VQNHVGFRPFQDPRRVVGNSNPGSAPYIGDLPQVLPHISKIDRTHDGNIFLPGGKIGDAAAHRAQPESDNSNFIRHW
jgi:hypothetical protein